MERLYFSFLEKFSLFRRKENRKEAKEREKPNPFIMKKKQGKGKSPTLTDIFLKGYNK